MNCTLVHRWKKERLSSLYFCIPNILEISNRSVYSSNAFFVLVCHTKINNNKNQSLSVWVVWSFSWRADLNVDVDFSLLTYFWIMLWKKLHNLRFFSKFQEMMWVQLSLEWRCFHYGLAFIYHSFNLSYGTNIKPFRGALEWVMCASASISFNLYWIKYILILWMLVFGNCHLLDKVVGGKL